MQRERQGRKRWHVDIHLLGLALILLAACTRRNDPQSILDHATQFLRHGDVAKAELEARTGYERFHGLSAEWAWKFRLLQGTRWRGVATTSEVLKLMASETAGPPSGELLARKLRLEGLAYAGQHSFTEANQKLAQAEDLCTVSLYPVCADVAACTW